jgi:iron complex transport system ATP-binding protein
MTEAVKTVKIDSLLIGFISGSRKNALLPPLSAEAEKGELVSVIGRNGIGKSTLLRSLAGIQDVLAGKIYHSGREINSYDRSGLARTIGFISTEQVKVSNMTVFDLVSLGRFPYTNWLGKLESTDLNSVHEAMEKTTVLRYSGKYVAELSDGERQRVMIARLLAQDASIMLMDEPTAFLDIRSKFEIVHLLHQLSHSFGKTIIITTHDLDLALRHSDRIWLILDDGIKEGSPEDLMLGGMFSHLFDSSVVQFNSLDGTYSFNEKSKGIIYVEGDNFTKHWTEKAIARAGYSVSAVNTPDKIVITPDQRWILTLNGETSEHSSIYALMRRMNSAI